MSTHDPVMLGIGPALTGPMPSVGPIPSNRGVTATGEATA